MSTAVKATRNEKGAARERLTTKRQLRGDSIPVAQVCCLCAGVVIVLTIAENIYGVVDNSGTPNGRVPDLSRHAAVLKPYSINASLGKGLGMFAAANIRKGTRILEEKPFFSLVERPELSEPDGYALDEIFEAFGRLSASDQDKYMSLHCPERPNCSVLVSIYEANCYEMGSGACICLDASRINHSCIPNAHYSWNTNIERETLHAVKDIFKGEEITISYCPAIATFDERKADLEPYFFTCRCPACRKDQRFGIMSQLRRGQMLDLDHKIEDFQIDAAAAQEEYDERNEKPAILRLVDLMDTEGLVYDKSRAYRDAAECALKQGLREEALEYAGKELDVESCCVGRDAPSYLEAISFFLKIYFGPEEIVD